MEKISKKTRKITTMGLFLALTIVLSFIEHQLPQLPPPFPPSMRFGLSNIMVMYTLFFLGWKEAYTLAVLKSVFVMLQRGPQAAFLSLIGGLLAVTVTLVLSKIFREHISYLMLSVAGAVFHNIGQMGAASIQLKTNLLVPVLPFILIAGTIMGVITGLLLRVVLPIFHQISGLEVVEQERKL